ncbi:MAG TPA: SRPBCC family protein [Candidatus Acidoferrales bacterium]|nr:SRPBCC family protein [Candidatus Acidoferrales bacterium]
MDRPRCAGSLAVALSVLAACSRSPSVDWSAPENFFAAEESQETDDGARLEFHSLVDAPAAKVYAALADLEHYASFVDGVTESVLVGTENDVKIIQITQSVIGRQSHARVRWTLHPQDLKLEFETLQSDQNYNDGSFAVTPSPDGKRCYVVSVYRVKWKGAPQNVPLGVLEAATRESYEKAAQSVKRRALS